MSATSSINTQQNASPNQTFANSAKAFMGKHKVEFLTAGAALALLVGGLVAVGLASTGAFGGSDIMAPVFAMIGKTFGGAAAAMGGVGLGCLAYTSLKDRVQTTPQSNSIELSSKKTASLHDQPDAAILEFQEAQASALTHPRKPVMKGRKHNSPSSLPKFQSAAPEKSASIAQAQEKALQLVKAPVSRFNGFLKPAITALGLAAIGAGIYMNNGLEFAQMMREGFSPLFQPIQF